MKIQEISLTNFARYDKVQCSFDEHVTYLIGNNGAGKSTLGLNAIWFMFMGIAEKSSAQTPTPLIGERFRFIGPKAATAKGEMILKDEKTGASITVTRKLKKDGTELSFEGPAGMTLNQAWLTELFNVFLIAPKRFIELSSKDQAKAIGIDTGDYDERIKKLKSDFTLINRDLKNIWEITEPDKITRVDIEALKVKKHEIRDRLNNKYLENKKANDDARKKWTEDCYNLSLEIDKFNEAQTDIASFVNKANEALAVLRQCGYDGNEVSDFIAFKQLSYKPLKQYVPLPEPTYIEERPDDSDLKAIDEQIEKAAEINQQAYEYEQYEIKLKAKEAKKQELQDNKDSQYQEETARTNYIKKFELPYDGMTVGEDGELLYNGRPLKEPYLSTGELLKIIPVLLSSQNPELKYVFIQDASLLDTKSLHELEDELIPKGFQLVFEYVGDKTLDNENCIILRDGVIVS